MSSRSKLSRRAVLLSTLAAGAGLLAMRAGVATAQAASKLKVRTESPLNAEPDLADLVKQQITPVEHFYIRNHGPIPKVEQDDYRLQIEGLVDKPLTLTLDQLRGKFKSHEQEATLTCAGNRRDEMSAIKPVGGVQWNAGAIGHATWEGPRLADLLKAAGLGENAKHIWFEGLDPIKEKDGSEAPFGGSIPIFKALESKAGVALLAFNMNGKPLTPEHGFPLRTVVPGYIGARSVKWLAKIVVSDRPSPNHYLAEAYKIVTSDDKQQLAREQPIYEFPVNAAICSPPSGAKLKAGKATISGYALPSGKDATIDKVEISLDGGKHWVPAEFAGEEPEARHKLQSNWRLWSCEVELKPVVSSVTVRATDSRGNVQPQETPWNYKGYLYNAWHKIDVEVS